MATRKPKEELSKRREALREEHAVAVREKIQTTALVNQLEAFALGKAGVKMNGTRLKAIEMLLDKTLPNLSSVKHEVDSKSVTFLISTEAEEPLRDSE